ncbi:uncharacterized protein LOC131437471 [Malaya genurostris]|uniref:uncharacterized protein LOC131437471 n=1 Tax=Malaya genurostris TaxID=325434 RepID=UPI0026F3BBCF|nr:uncharacterized protein LOC131437471 [Malaya genurostris]
MTTRWDFLQSANNEHGHSGAGDISVGGEEDDDSDTLTELSFSRSPTSSLGRSSTSSIPWAEDAIKQNQLEWERIERMFYGEEELPKESKIREEFLEWMTAFPHLRINGCAIRIQENPAAKPTDPFYEEVLAIDPPFMNRVRSSRSGNISKPIKECEFQFVPNDIERYLHISSGQIKRNNHRNAKDLVKNNSDPLITFVDTVEKPPKARNASNQSFGILISNSYNYLTNMDLPNSRNSSAQSVKHFNNSIMHKKLAPLGQRPQPRLVQLEKPILSSSASATNSRIPPLGSNIKFIVRNSHAIPSVLATELVQRNTKFSMIKSATSSRYPLSPTKNVVTLPSLAVLESRERTGTNQRSSRKPSFNSEIVGRSISAAVTQKNLPKHNGNVNTPKWNVVHYP